MTEILPLDYYCEQFHCIIGPHSINKRAEVSFWKSSACTTYFDQNSQIPTFSIRRSPLSSLSCLKTAKETAKIAEKSNNSNLSDCLSTVVIRIAECSIWSEWSYFFFILRHWTLISYKNVSYSTRVQPVSWRHFEPNLFPEMKIPMRFA